VVDDQALNRIATAIVLEDLGFEVHLAASGREALVQVQAHKYDVIVMDYEMPEMNGLDCSRRIRQMEMEGESTLTNRKSRVAIIAFSGSADENLREECLRSGMDDFVCKSASSEQLIAAVAKFAPL
jgi:CheY-like chemotaxis protein